jgi:hypothetical protein
VQIAEDSIVGVRAAVITLSRQETPLRSQLYPMLHIGDRGYYREITRRLRDSRQASRSTRWPLTSRRTPISKPVDRRARPHQIAPR